MPMNYVLIIWGILALISAVVLIISLIQEKREKGERVTFGDVCICLIATVTLLPLALIFVGCVLWVIEKLFPALYEPLKKVDEETKQKFYNAFMTIWIIFFLFVLLPNLV